MYGDLYLLYTYFIWDIYETLNSDRHHKEGEASHLIKKSTNCDCTLFVKFIFKSANFKRTLTSYSKGVSLLSARCNRPLPAGRLIISRTGIRIGRHISTLCLLQELVLSISSPGDIVVDLFRGKFSLAVAYLTLQEEGHKPLRTFVSIKSDKECFEVALRNLSEVFARVILTAKHPYTLFGPYFPTAEYIEDTRLLLAHAGFKNITETATASLSKWRPPAEILVLPVLSSLDYATSLQTLERYKFLENFVEQAIS